MIEAGSQAFRKTSFALAFGSFLVFCNLYLFQPMLPLMVEHFAISATKANWLLAASTFGLAFTLVPWAMISERIGRRPVMLFSLSLMPVVGALMLLSESFLYLVIMRAFMGIALAGFAAVAVAYMAEEFSPAALMTAVGVYISANSLGGIVGRISGGVLTGSFGWEGAVIAMALFTSMGVTLVIWLLPRQQHFEPAKVGVLTHSRAVIDHFRNPVIWLAMLIGGINFALFVNLYSVMAFRLVAPPYSLPISFASMIFLCYLAGTLSSSLSGRWTAKHSPIQGMVVGSLLLALGVLVASHPSIPAMLIGLLIISGGAFFTHSLAYAWVSRNAKEGKATATALYLVHYYTGGSLGGFLLIASWQHRGWLGVVLASTALIAAMLFAIGLLKKRLSRPPAVTPEIHRAEVN